MKKTIRDYDLNNKKVIIRVDFNVPIKDGKIEDDTRLKASIETINYAIKNGAKVILFSHMGRIKSEADKVKNDLSIVVPRLEELLGQTVTFVPKTRGAELEETISNMNMGDVVLIQNTRYEDYPDNLESSNDKDLGLYWSSLGDIFINDAFGTSHREHASNVGIASYLPSGVGFLIEKELNAFESMLACPARPFTVILGGSKVSDKIRIIENLAPKADYILIGGGMAYTFLYASGISIGASLLDKEHVVFCQNMLEKYSDKIILPIDSVVTTSIEDISSSRTCFINEIKDNEIGVDIGYNTIKLFSQYLKQSKTVLWNGPVGIFEVDDFSNGTKGILEVFKNLDAVKVVGGGDTASSVHKFGYSEYMSHISTGGGASLELLEGQTLPGIGVICEK